MLASKPVGSSSRPEESLDPSRFVNLAEVAEMLGLSRRTLIRMARRGEGPTILKLYRGRYLVDLAELEAWLDTRRLDRLDGQEAAR